MPYSWSTRSRARLDTCHPLLVQLMDRVIVREDLPSDLTILCGHRGQEAQDAAHGAGLSKYKWPRSKHNTVPSMAVDVGTLVGGQVTWDWPRYHLLAVAIKNEWGRMQDEGLTSGWDLVWGGDWTTLKDGPHWELREVTP